MVKKILFLLLLAVPVVGVAQQKLYVNEYKFFELSDPPMDGYIESAWWSCDKYEIGFDEASEVGAIIYPKRYFEGTATIKCTYNFSYYGYDDRLHASTGYEYFYVTCKAVTTTLSDSYVEINPGKQYSLKYSQSSTPFGTMTPEWESSNTDIVTINSKGVIKALSIGVARITCDPLIGPKVYCEVRVCEDDGTGTEDNPNDDANNTSAIEKSIERINNLKARTMNFLKK